MVAVTVPPVRRGWTADDLRLDGAGLTFMQVARGMTYDGRTLALVELEITRLLQGAPSIEAVAEDILRMLCLDLHWDLAELWLLDADSGLTRRTATWRASWAMCPR